MQSLENTGFFIDSPQNLRSFQKIVKLIMRGIMHGILVTTMHDVIHIFQNNVKIRCCVEGLRADIHRELFCLADDFAQAAAAALHEYDAVE